GELPDVAAADRGQRRTDAGAAEGAPPRGGPGCGDGRGRRCRSGCGDRAALRVRSRRASAGEPPGEAAPGRHAARLPGSRLRRDRAGRGLLRGRGARELPSRNQTPQGAAEMSGMDCDAVRDLLPLLAYGGPAGADRARVVAHVRTCARCRADGELLTLLRRHAAKAPQDLAARILAAHAARPRAWRPAARPYALAAALAGALL